MQQNQSPTALGLPTVTRIPENYNSVLDSLFGSFGGCTGTNTAILLIQSQLNDYNNFYEGLKSYTSGVQSASINADCHPAG